MNVLLKRRSVKGKIISYFSCGGRMEILSYISAHWIEWLFMIVTAIIGFGYRTVLKRLQEEKQRNEAIAEGVQSLLRESIVNSYNKYQDKGFCPIYAKESIRKVYLAYHNLGGNDVATNLYNNVLNMKEEPEGKEKNE